MLPLLGTTLMGTPSLAIPSGIPGAAYLNGVKVEEAPTPEELLRAQRAAKIDAFFAERDMPIAGYGMKFVEVAEENGLDPFLLPAIVARESSGYKDPCNKFSTNGFGWHSCKVGFKTIDEAIEVVGKNLGGNNPSTAQHYEGKDTVGILNAYNPPSIVAKYTPQVLHIMKTIANQKLLTNDTVATKQSESSES